MWKMVGERAKEDMERGEGKVRQRIGEKSELRGRQKGSG